MDKDLIVTIFVPTTDENGNSRSGTEGEIGTGYPVADNLILTSRHVVKPERVDVNYLPRVRWHYLTNQTDMDQGWIKIQWEDIVWIGNGDETDAALLRCPRPAGAENRDWGVVSNRKPAFNSTWQSTGFSRATRYNDIREPGEFSGTVESMADNADFFEINVTSHPESIELWKGASGMPVIVNGEILGVVCSAQPNFSAKKLRVIPTWKMLRDDIDFQKHLGIDQRKEYLERTMQKIASFLHVRDAGNAAKKLADSLGLIWVDHKTSSSELAKRILELPIERLFHAVEDVRLILHDDQDSAGLSILTDIIKLVVPILVCPVLVEDIRRRKSDPTIGLISLPIAINTVAEIVMAGVDRREIRYRPLEQGNDWPEGEASLTGLPEGGRDKDGSQFKSDFRRQLYGQLESGVSDQFVKIFDMFMRIQFVGNDMRQRLANKDAGAFDQYINNVLADSAKNKKLTYYFILPVSDKTQERVKQQVIIRELKERYRHIVFLELNNDVTCLLSEQETYLPLTRIVS